MPVHVHNAYADAPKIYPAGKSFGVDSDGNLYVYDGGGAKGGFVAVHNRGYWAWAEIVDAAPEAP